MVDVAVGVVFVAAAVAEVGPHPELMSELEQRVGLAPLLFLPRFAALLLDDAASGLAFAFAFHGFDEWLLLQGRIQDNGRPYIDDSDSEHIVN